MLQVAIVGGGPSGLMAAKLLQEKLADSCRIAIYEASGRLGGKVVTRTFDRAPVKYEAGAAELYDYSMIGPDPLRDLVDELGLEIDSIDGDHVQIDGELLRGVEGVRERHGEAAGAAIEQFRLQCSEMLSPGEYCDSSHESDNVHPWAGITGEDVLQREVSHAFARRFLRTVSRSDIATDARHTNGLNALKNFLMDVEGYIGLYTIRGGNEGFVRQLASSIEASVHLNHRVVSIGQAPEGSYELEVECGQRKLVVTADVALVCLPHAWLSTLDWRESTLSSALQDHVAHFDHPAHYLRVALLFDAPFWENRLEGDWIMSEAFGGCCVYVERVPFEGGEGGVLNWLITGSEALAYCNEPEQELIDSALRTLPSALGDAREHFLEAKVHRWMSSVSALPGGHPARDPEANHYPDPEGSPGLFLAGDYLFDSTLNGALESADFATGLIAREAGRLSR